MGKKYKVLFIGPYPPPYSGPEISMKYLLESPLGRRFDVSFLNTNVRRSNEKKGNVDIFLVWAFFLFVSRLVWMLVTKRPALVYYFITATRLGWLGRDVWCIFISHLFGAKVVLHMRGGNFRDNYDEGGRLTKRIIRTACSLVSRGIVQSRNLKRQFEGLIPDERIVAIHNMIDCVRYSPGNQTDYNKNMIFFMGHLSHAKGYCDLLRIIPDVVLEYPDVVFHFAGTKIKQEKNVFYNQVTGERILFDDPETSFERNIKGRCEKNYVYHGMIDETLKLELLRECNFFVLPSYSEGFSMAVLEALSMGKPVVTTPVGALADVVAPEVNGLLSVPGDLNSLKSNIFRLLSDQELRDRMGRTNACYVRKHFTVEEVSSQIANCFYQTLTD